MAPAEQTAERIIKLINSSPRSPRKDELIAVLQGDHAANGAEMVMVVPGAYIRVGAGGELEWQGFHVSHPEPTRRNCQLAILEWMRARILANGRVR